MEAVSSCSSSPGYCGVELDQLLEVFGSVFSLEDINSAFMQANCNIDVAGEILSELHVTAPSSDLYQPKEEIHQSSATSERLFHENTSPHPQLAETNCKELKFKEGPLTIGSIAGVMGKDYVRPKSSVKEFSRESKPPKNDTEESKVSGSSSETLPSSSTMASGSAQKDIDEFLFKMLGDGFQLDMTVIREVLGACGHNMEKCMETLLDLSASKLTKSDDILNKASETPSDGFQDRISLSCQDKAQFPCSSRLTNKRNKDKSKLEREVLQSLFSFPERSEELPMKNVPRRASRRSMALGKVVTEPLKHTTIEHKTVTVKPLQISDDEGECDDSFEILRQAVKEHWASMKEYYQAAAEAFAMGDHARAHKLMEKGQFFNRKAREADEKSVLKLMGTSCRDEEVLVDLSIHEPKEAVKLLRVHLPHLCAIPSIPYLKVKVGSNERDGKEGSRKRLILKFLDKESVEWSETENGQTIIIRVGKIDPKSLRSSK